MGTVRINQRWPENLKRAVDSASRDAGMNATEWTVDALQRKLTPEGVSYTVTGERETIHFTPNLPPEPQDEENRPFVCPRSDCDWPGAYTPTAQCTIHGRRVVGRSKGA